MRRSLFAFLFVPVSAWAGDGAGASFFFSLLQMLAALAVVVGLIYLVSHLSNKWLKGGLVGNLQQRHIRVVETRFLAPKKSLILVEVGGRFLLLGSAGENLNLVTELEGLEEKESEKSTSLVPFQERLQSFVQRLKDGGQSKNPFPAGMPFSALLQRFTADRVSGGKRLSKQ